MNNNSIETIDRYFDFIDTIREPDRIIKALDYFEEVLREEEGLFYMLDEKAYNILIDRLLDQYEQIGDYFRENYPPE